MSTYYFHDGNDQIGPLSYDELISRPLKRDTHVWKDGTASWVKAEDLDELKDYFKMTPPPLYFSEPELEAPQADTRAKRKFPFRIVLGFILLGIVAAYFWNKYYNDVSDDLILNSSTTREKTPGELRAELASKERDNPTQYLFVKGTYRKNFIGETVLEGEISNRATLAVFKDVVIKASYLGPSGTTISEETFIKYQLVYPRGAIEFKFKTFAPKQTESVNIVIQGASPAE